MGCMSIDSAGGLQANSSTRSSGRLKWPVMPHTSSRQCDEHTITAGPRSVIDSQFVADFENPGYVIRSVRRQLTLQLGCHCTFESDSAVFNNNVDWRHSPHGIAK